MLPTNVGEIRKLIEGLPDEMLFDLDLNASGSINDIQLEVKDRYCGYDGTKCCPKYQKMLVLTVEVVD